MTNTDKVKGKKIRKIKIKNAPERFCAIVWEVDDEVKVIIDTEDELNDDSTYITYNTEEYYLVWFVLFADLAAAGCNTNKIEKMSGFYWDEAWDA